MGRVSRGSMIDNARPDDPNYPTAAPPKTAYSPDGTEITLRIGDYVVNREGDIVIVTSVSTGPYDEYLASISPSYFRAKYIGNRDDSIQFANQCRLATMEEIARAASYRQGGLKVTDAGQVVLL